MKRARENKIKKKKNKRKKVYREKRNFIKEKKTGNRKMENQMGLANNRHLNPLCLVQ